MTAIDLKAIDVLTAPEINPSLVEVLVRKNASSPAPAWIVLDQITNSLITNKLTFSAPGVTAVAVAPTALPIGSQLTVTIDPAYRAGYITGEKVSVTDAATGGALTGSVDSYNVTTGQLLFTIETHLGASTSANWRVSYLAATIDATTVFFTPGDAYPAGVDTLQEALDYFNTYLKQGVKYFSFTATAAQVSYAPAGGYNKWGLIVTRNGSILEPTEYTATDGTTITFTVPLTAGQKIQVLSFAPFTVANPLDAATLDAKTPAYYLS